MLAYMDDVAIRFRNMNDFNYWINNDEIQGEWTRRGFYWNVAKSAYINVLKGKLEKSK